MEQHQSASEFLKTILENKQVKRVPVMHSQEKRVKLILTYDPGFEDRETYLQFVMGQFLPTLEFLGLSLCDSWHTAYGEYPLRLIGFSATDIDILDQILSSEAFCELEANLISMVDNYNRKIIPERQGFPQ